jgi:hypothetical protein
MRKGTSSTAPTLNFIPRMKDFYKFFKYNGKVIDIFDYEESI